MSNARQCLVSTLIILAGCTTQPNKVVNDGPDLQCHSVEATGSLITKSVCTTRAQRAAEQAELGDIRQQIEARSGADTRPTAPVAQ
jgi:hypothetical protein